MSFTNTLHDIMCKTMPEAIINKIYKDSHEITYCHVMADILRLNHKKKILKYWKVLFMQDLIL
jgi:hypothetical protein